MEFLVHFHTYWGIDVVQDEWHWWTLETPVHTKMDDHREGAYNETVILIFKKNYQPENKILNEYKNLYILLIKHFSRYYVQLSKLLEIFFFG